MKVSRGKVAAISDISIDDDLDFGGDYQCSDLASPASGEALRKGNRDIGTAEISLTANILATQIANTAMTRALITAQGDMITRSGSVPKKLTLGTEGHYLRAGASEPGWSALAILTHYLLWGVLSEEIPAEEYLNATTKYFAHGILPHEDCVITKIGFLVGGKAGNGSDLIIEMWSDSGGDADAVITNGSVTIAVGDVVPDGMNWAVFSTPPSLTGGTKYHVVLRSSDADGSNAWNIEFSDVEPTYGLGWWGVGCQGREWNPSSWADSDPIIDMIYGRKV